MAKTQINLDGWQDYRGSHTGAVLYIETSHQSVVPVRDQLNENGKGYFYEPNYETSTMGFISCCSPKVLNDIVKPMNKLGHKCGYILFGTRYEGAVTQFKRKFLIIGYQEIKKVRDVRSRHMQRFLMSGSNASGPDAVRPECATLDKSMATYGPMRFVSLADGFVITDELLKDWGYTTKANRQVRVTLKAEHLDIVLAHLDSKEDMTDTYIATAEEYKEILAEQEG